MKAIYSHLGYKDVDKIADYAETNIIGAPASFGTGGYTGEWGTDGRLALLHEKELVLNPEDTKNILDVVELTKAVIKSIDLVNTINSHDLSALKSSTLTEMTGKIEQDVHITAEFPNATDREEIKAAFDDIINEAV